VCLRSRCYAAECFFVSVLCFKTHQAGRRIAQVACGPFVSFVLACCSAVARPCRTLKRQSFGSSASIPLVRCQNMPRHCCELISATSPPCSLAKRCLRRARQRGASRQSAARIAATVLARAAVDRGSRDNVTVVVIDLSR